MNRQKFTYWFLCETPWLNQGINLGHSNIEVVLQSNILISLWFYANYKLFSLSERIKIENLHQSLCHSQILKKMCSISHIYWNFLLVEKNKHQSNWIVSKIVPFSLIRFFFVWILLTVLLGDTNTEVGRSSIDKNECTHKYHTLRVNDTQLVKIRVECKRTRKYFYLWS